MVKDTRMSLMSSTGAFSGEFEITEKWSGYNDDIDLGSSILIARNKITTIGRALKNTVKINHLAISGTHCMIWVVQFDENSVPLVYIKDMSLNGTYVNGSRLAKKEVMLLRHGDIVSIPFGLEMEFRAVYGGAESDVGQQLIEENYIRTNFGLWTIKDRVLGNGTFGYVRLIPTILWRG
jgi:meiosis-specific serine/threonine-protein kinase MEK1